MNISKNKVYSIFFHINAAIITLLFLFCVNANAELAKRDTEEIRKIVREELVHVDKRFEQIDKRLEESRQDMNKRFDQMLNFMWMMAVIFSSITAATISFAIWDRRTMIRPFEVKVAQIEARIKDIEEKKLVTLIDSLREIAKSDNKVADALQKFNLL